MPAGEDRAEVAHGAAARRSGFRDGRERPVLPVVREKLSERVALDPSFEGMNVVGKAPGDFGKGGIAGGGRRLLFI